MIKIYYFYWDVIYIFEFNRGRIIMFSIMFSIGI